MIHILINVITLVTCALIGCALCGALNINYNIVRYNKVNKEYFLAVLIGFVSIGCNVLLLFVLINIKGF